MVRRLMRLKVIRLIRLKGGEMRFLGKRHKRGEVPPSNEAQMGHQISRKNGGSDTAENLEIESRKCNRANGANNR